MIAARLMKQLGCLGDAIGASTVVLMIRLLVSIAAELSSHVEPATHRLRSDILYRPPVLCRTDFDPHDQCVRKINRRSHINILASKPASDRPDHGTFSVRTFCKLKHRKSATMPHQIVRPRCGLSGKSAKHTSPFTHQYPTKRRNLTSPRAHARLFGVERSIWCRAIAVRRRSVLGLAQLRWLRFGRES